MEKQTTTIKLKQKQKKRTKKCEYKAKETKDKIY